jgi:hypothetical protein
MKAIWRSEWYRDAIKFALIQQAIVLVLAANFLDLGVMLAICLYAAIGFWAGVALICFRRPIPTRPNLAMIKFGYVPLCAVSFLVAELSHHWALN